MMPDATMMCRRAWGKMCDGYGKAGVSRRHGLTSIRSEAPWDVMLRSGALLRCKMQHRSRLRLVGDDSGHVEVGCCWWVVAVVCRCRCRCRSRGGHDVARQIDLPGSDRVCVSFVSDFGPDTTPSKPSTALLS